MGIVDWYKSTYLPDWVRPTRLYVPAIWIILYIVIAVTFTSVFYKAAIGQWPAMVALPFALNLIFNIAFAPLQFGLKNSALVSIDGLLAVATIGWAFVVIYPYAPWIIWANIPYLLWSGFLLLLQEMVTAGKNHTDRVEK